MNKIFLFISLIIIAGCNHNETESSIEPLQTEGAAVPIAEGMQEVDLTKQGLPILIHIPNSPFTSPQITENVMGGIDVKAGDDFQISIMEGSGDFNMKKQDISNDAVRKLVRYVVDEPNLLFWQWQMEALEPEFHFYTVIKSGTRSFEVQDMDGIMFSENAIAKMLEAAKTIRLKP